MIKCIFKREFLNFFITPLAYTYIAIFLLLSSLLTFYVGNFFERSSADLDSFFIWNPWLFLFFLPSLTMKTWSEEKRIGTIEILKTLPITSWQLVIGKFLAIWAIAALSIILTFPLWISVNILGSPDNSVILGGYMGSLIMAGAFIAIGSAISSFTKNSIIAFIVTILICFIFTVSGYPLIINFLQGWLPQILLDTISSLSFITNFNEMFKGVIYLNTVLYFFILITFLLFINAINIKYY